MENICVYADDWFLCKLPAVEVISIREPAVLFRFLQVTFVALPAVVTSVNRQLGSVRQQVALPPLVLQRALIKLLFFNVLRSNTFDLFLFDRL